MVSNPKSKNIEHTNNQMTTKKTKGKRTEDTLEDIAKIFHLENELKKAKNDNAELRVESRMHRNSLAKKIHEVEGLLHDTRKD